MFLSDEAYDRHVERMYDAYMDAQSRRGIVSACGDRTCGAPDCRACYPDTLGACRVCHGIIGADCDCDAEDE